MESLRQLKIEDKNMFVDKQSGKNLERKKLSKDGEKIAGGR